MGGNDNLPWFLTFLDLLEKQVATFLSHLIGLMGNGGQCRFHVVGMKFVGITDQGDIGRYAEMMFLDFFHGGKSQCVIHCQDCIRRFRQ